MLIFKDYRLHYLKTKNRCFPQKIRVISLLKIRQLVFNFTINYKYKKLWKKYLKDLRKISSATYRYNWENKQSRPESHLAFISQSLPNSVQMTIDQSPSKSGEPMIGYNLSNMAGLTVIMLKVLDAKLTAQEEIIQKLQKRLDLLEK